MRRDILIVEGMIPVQVTRGHPHHTVQRAWHTVLKHGGTNNMPSTSTHQHQHAPAGPWGRTCRAPASTSTAVGCLDADLHAARWTVLKTARRRLTPKPSTRTMCTLHTLLLKAGPYSDATYSLCSYTTCNLWTLPRTSGCWPGCTLQQLYTPNVTYAHAVGCQQRRQLEGGTNPAHTPQHSLPRQPQHWTR